MVPPTFPLQNELTYGLEITLAQNRNYCLADGFLRLARHGNGIQLFLRYQAQTERLYRRAKISSVSGSFGRSYRTNHVQWSRRSSRLPTP